MGALCLQNGASKGFAHKLLPARLHTPMRHELKTVKPVRTLQHPIQLFCGHALHDAHLTAVNLCNSNSSLARRLEMPEFTAACLAAVPALQHQA